MLRPRLARFVRNKWVRRTAHYTVGATTVAWLIPELEDFWYDNKGMKQEQFPDAVRVGLVGAAPVTMAGLTLLTGLATVSAGIEWIKERLAS